jgi:hypothetical protein
MNPIRRIITAGAAVLLAAASSIVLAGSALACELVVDPFTGTPQCIDTSQPSYAPSANPSPWLGIGVGVFLLVAAVVLLVRGRFPKRAPASGRPQPGLDVQPEFLAAEPADFEIRLAELEAELQGQRNENERLRTELEMLRTA